MIDRNARNALIGLIRRILDGKADINEVLTESIATEDETVATIEEHLIECRARLPLSPGDDVLRPSPQTRAEMERAIVFLSTDLEREEESMSWFDRGVLACMVLFLIGLVMWVIADNKFILPVANTVRWVTLVCGAIFLGRLLLMYLAITLGAAIHIFKVRVLKQTVSDLRPDDVWPFESNEQLREVRMYEG